MRKRSIRFKLTLWFSVVLIAVAGTTFLAVLASSRMVLRGTIRDYLISTVEENVDNIQFVTAKSETASSSYIPYASGYLMIDLDFMKVINNVYTALYTDDGDMLYGENPLSRETVGLAFTESHIWHMNVKGVRYNLYDRRLNIALPDGSALWIRGVVPETKSTTQLTEIVQISMILLPIIIILSGLSAYLLADRLLLPIRNIEKTAEEISKKDDLKKRIEVKNSGDEVGKLAGAFNRMLDRLENSFETEQRFTSDASHELRTPTSVILAQTEYTLGNKRSPEEYVEALEVIRRQGKRMNSLISDMLDYTRMAQSPERYKHEQVDLSGLVLETAKQMELIGSRGISLRAQVQQGLTVNGNGMLLARLLQNLIGNAYRYGRENGHVLVSLTGEGSADCGAEGLPAASKGPGIILAVTDDGIGISQEDLPKIFDRFYRSDSSRSVQGTGLGLSMVKKIAELHGADVEVISEPDKGSTFRIFFPQT